MKYEPCGVVCFSANLVKPLAEDLALAAVHLGQAVVVVLPERKARADRLLQRRGRADRQEVMHLLHALGQIRHVRRRNQEAETPARDRKRLGERVAGNHPAPSAGERCRRNVLIRREHNVLIHLVRDHERVVLLRVAQNLRQLFAGKHLAAGVRGVADDDRLRVLAKRVLEAPSSRS